MKWDSVFEYAEQHTSVLNSVLVRKLVQGKMFTSWYSNLDTVQHNITETLKLKYSTCICIDILI